MSNGDILAVNVPNTVSITIMALIGALLLGWVHKWYYTKQKAGAEMAAVATGA